MFLFTKKCCRLGSLITVLVCWVGNVLSAREVIEGEMMSNPFMNEHYNYWVLDSGWRNDGEHDRLVFDIKEGNMGSPAAVGRGKHFEFDPGTGHLSAKLTGFIFNSPYIQVYDSNAIGSSADYNLYFEVDIATTSGEFYRAQSRPWTEPWTLQRGDLDDFYLNWLTDEPFLGDPSSAPEGGIPVESIKDVYYRVVMNVAQATDPDTGPVFITIDNLSLTFKTVIE